MSNPVKFWLSKIELVETLFSTFADADQKRKLAEIFDQVYEDGYGTGYIDGLGEENEVVE